MNLRALRRVRRSLRARLITATVLLSFAALATAGAATELVARQVVLEAVRSHLDARAREARDALERFQRERAMTVQLWAESDAMQRTLDTQDLKFAEDYLRRTVQDQDGAIDIAALVGLDGRAVAAVRFAPGRVRRAERLVALRGARIAVDALDRALETHRPAVTLAPLSAVAAAAPPGAVAIVLVSPVVDFANDLVGAVVATIAPAAFDGLLTSMTAGSPYLPFATAGEGLVTVGAARGRVDPSSWTTIAPAVVQRVTGGGASSLVVHTHPSDEQPGWSAAMAVPESVALGPLRRLRWALVGTTIVVLATASAASVRTVRRAARPLTDLSTSIRRVACGDLSARVVENQGEELGQVARSFNRMVAEVERSREVLRRTEALRREMQIAHRIQTSILPASLTVAGFDVAARMRPADDVGGDYYDLLAFPDTFWLLVGDVSGHGVQSGLVMMMAQAAAYAHVASNPGCSPADVIVAVNRVLHENVVRRMRRDDYATLMAARHVGGGRFVAAGAHQPLFVARDGGSVELVETVGPYCGPLPELAGRVEEYGFTLRPGDSLCLITDGVVEARDRHGALFGEERLVATLGGEPVRSAHEAVERVFRTVDRFMDRQEDDMTVLMIRREARRG